MAEYCNHFEFKEDNRDSFRFWDGLRGQGVPEGGTTGQLLAKKTNTDFDTEWITAGMLPAGGSAGQVLKKSSGSDYAAEWDSLAAGDIAYSDQSGYSDGTVGKEVSSLKNAINDLGLSVIDGKLNITFEE